MQNSVHERKRENSHDYLYTMATLLEEFFITQLQSEKKLLIPSSPLSVAHLGKQVQWCSVVWLRSRGSQLLNKLRQEEWVLLSCYVMPGNRTQVKEWTKTHSAAWLVVWWAGNIYSWVWWGVDFPPWLPSSVRQCGWLSAAHCSKTICQLQSV